jgi:hypothetical protein
MSEYKKIKPTEEIFLKLKGLSWTNEKTPNIKNEYTEYEIKRITKLRIIGFTPNCIRVHVYEAKPILIYTYNLKFNNQGQVLYEFKQLNDDNIFNKTGGDKYFLYSDKNNNYLLSKDGKDFLTFI